MNKWIFIVSLFLMVGCKQEQTNDLLQSHDVRLVKPRVTATNQIIDSSVIVSAELRMEAVKMYMTSDGSEPSENSKLYVQPLQITEPGIYKFKAFHSEWQESETEIITLIKKGKSVDSIIWLSEANSKYSGRGIKTLVNNTKARVNYMDPEWVGFDTIAKAITVFKEKTFIKTLDIGYLNNTGAWIFPPEQIQVFVSYDGVGFVAKEKLNLNPLAQGTDQRVETIQLLINEAVKAIRIEVKNVAEIPEWHEGNAKTAWLFMDEWIFN